MLLHHNTHVHTFVGGTGAQGSFVVENHGAIGTFSYEIILTATDSSGLDSEHQRQPPVVARHRAADGARGADGDARGCRPGQPGWTAVDRQRRR